MSYLGERLVPQSEHITKTRKKITKNSLHIHQHYFTSLNYLLTIAQVQSLESFRYHHLNPENELTNSKNKSRKHSI